MAGITREPAGWQTDNWTKETVHCVTGASGPSHQVTITALPLTSQSFSLQTQDAIIENNK